MRIGEWRYENIINEFQNRMKQNLNQLDKNELVVTDYPIGRVGIYVMLKLVQFFV